MNTPTHSPAPENQAFPMCDALRHELSWTHYRTLLRVENETARQWYMDEAAAQNWSSRALDRQIGTLYYERLTLSQDKQAVAAEANANLDAIKQTPRGCIWLKTATMAAVRW